MNGGPRNVVKLQHLLGIEMTVRWAGWAGLEEGLTAPPPPWSD